MRLSGNVDTSHASAAPGHSAAIPIMNQSEWVLLTANCVVIIAKVVPNESGGHNAAIKNQGVCDHSNPGS
ncbi:MAG: hypothetical protein KC708_13165 [Anaerolineae bacterium]|nr:hypothetical protein [Anaerolineae bacterium]